MRKIKIVSDSSSDLFTLEKCDHASAPMKIITNDREFVDTPMLDVEEMISFLDSYKDKSRSSCPNTEDWLSAFGDAEEIFCVTITSGLSGSYNSACLAKKTYEAEHPTRKVFILDSLSTGPEMVLIIKKLEQLIDSGESFEKICSEITEYSHNTGLVFMLKSLKNFANNGRISPIVAKLIGFAGICIVGKASDEGTLKPLHKCRGEVRAIQTLVSELRDNGFESGKISIGHAMNPSAAEMLKSKITEVFGNVDIEIHPLRGLCSFYAERGGLLVGFEKQ